MECTQDRFLREVRGHSMRILRDDGVYRHIRYACNGSAIYRFDLLTWPGALCITGDCGTYVFRRLDDMFEFFRQPVPPGAAGCQVPLVINPGYWGEKLESVGVNAGYTEFDAKAFECRVKEVFSDWVESEQPTAERAAIVWDEIANSVLRAAEDGKVAAYQAIHDFASDTFQFEDFFDCGGTVRFTYHFLWCLHAIVWGIRQYDARRPERSSS